MNSAVLIAAVVLAIVILWLALQIAQSQRKSSALESQLSELRRDLLSVAQTQSQSAGRIPSIGQTLSQRLARVTQALQDPVTPSPATAPPAPTATAPPH